MPIEEAAIGSIFRILVWLVMEIFLQSICWGVGWLTLKMLTLGHYPKPGVKNAHVIAVGFIVLVSVVVAVVIVMS